MKEKRARFTIAHVLVVAIRESNVATSIIRLIRFFAAVLVLASAGTSYAKPIVGAPAPAFSGTTLNGEQVSLDSLRGQVIVLNFWATWCGPCKQELPRLDAAARKPEYRGLRIVAVTTDADKVPVSAIQSLQSILSFPLLKVFSGVYEPIGRAIPTNYIIDRDGVLRYARAGALEADDIAELVGPLLAKPGARPQAPSIQTISAPH